LRKEHKRCELASLKGLHKLSLQSRPEADAAVEGEPGESFDNVDAPKYCRSWPNARRTHRKKSILGHAHERGLIVMFYETLSKGPS
jgi:hypothetical protein